MSTTDFKGPQSLVPHSGTRRPSLAETLPGTDAWVRFKNQSPHRPQTRDPITACLASRFRWRHLPGVCAQPGLLYAVNGACLIVIRIVAADTNRTDDFVVRSANEHSTRYWNDTALRDAGK